MADDNGDIERLMLDEARIEVSFADHKASMVLAALGIGLGALFGGILAGDWNPRAQEGLDELVWWIGAVLAAGSVLLAACAVWPRYSKHTPGDGVYYWGHVARFSSLEQLSEHMERTPPLLVDRTRHQLWEMSRIVSFKYRLIRGAFVLAGLGAAAFGISALLGS
jgi:hypothetical protein